MTELNNCPDCNTHTYKFCHECQIMEDRKNEVSEIE